MIEAVIFDIGNVLIEWQPERYYDRLLGEEARRRMFAEIDLHAMNDKVDRGGNLALEVARCAEANPDWRAPILRWHSDWSEIAGPEIPGSVQLLRALRAKGVPVFALTNFGDEIFAHAQGVYPFLTEFDRFYVSGRMKMAKPDAEIYAALERDCGLPPEHLLFADDRLDNIEMARSRGWQVHPFTTPDLWAERLIAEGLLEGADLRG